MSREWKRGDRVSIYTNKGKMGRGTVMEPPPISVANNAEMEDYMRVRLDTSKLVVNVKSSICKRLVKR